MVFKLYYSGRKGPVMLQTTITNPNRQNTSNLRKYLWKLDNTWAKLGKNTSDYNSKCKKTKYMQIEKTSVLTWEHMHQFDYRCKTLKKSVAKAGNTIKVFPGNT